MKILFLTRYGAQGASSRMRSIQFVPGLRASGIECELSPLFSDAQLVMKYRNGNYRIDDVVMAYWQRLHALREAHLFDLVWIEKEALPWCPCWVEQYFLKKHKYVMDFDDAIFHNYDLHQSALVRF